MHIAAVHGVQHMPILFPIITRYKPQNCIRPICIGCWKSPETVSIRIGGGRCQGFCFLAVVGDPIGSCGKAADFPVFDGENLDTAAGGCTPVVDNQLVDAVAVQIEVFMGDNPRFSPIATVALGISVWIMFFNFIAACSLRQWAI